MTKIAKQLITTSIVVFLTLAVIGYFDTDFEWLLAWWWCSIGFFAGYWQTDTRKLAKDNTTKEG